MKDDVKQVFSVRCFPLAVSLDSLNKPHLHSQFCCEVNDLCRAMKSVNATRAMAAICDLQPLEASGQLPKCDNYSFKSWTNPHQLQDLFLRPYGQFRVHHFVHITEVSF